eukprot:15044513-Alexandrium_andersonii.AAC.1
MSKLSKLSELPEINVPCMCRLAWPWSGRRPPRHTKEGITLLRDLGRLWKRSQAQLPLTQTTQPKSLTILSLGPT